MGILIMSGTGGALFDPRSSSELITLLRRLREDRPYRDELAAQAVRRASDFSWETTARRTLEVYAEAKEKMTRAPRPT